MTESYLKVFYKVIPQVNVAMEQTLQALYHELKTMAVMMNQAENEGQVQDYKNSSKIWPDNA